MGATPNTGGKVWQGFYSRLVIHSSVPFNSSSVASLSPGYIMHRYANTHNRLLVRSYPYVLVR